MDELFALVQQEMDRQDAKWGSNQIDTTEIWLSRIIEELGEVAKANNERDARQYVTELVQVAAVAIQAIKSFRLEMEARRVQLDS